MYRVGNTPNEETVARTTYRDKSLMPGHKMTQLVMGPVKGTRTATARFNERGPRPGRIRSDTVHARTGMFLQFRRMILVPCFQLETRKPTVKLCAQLRAQESLYSLVLNDKIGSIAISCGPFVKIVTFERV